MPPKANPTAANAPVACSAPDCDYTVPAKADLATALQFLTLHIQTAHPKPPGPNPTDRPITKVELRSRPEVTMDTSEADWRFFLSEWKDYKRVTGITGQAILDELWSCMKGDLKRLAFDQGGKDNLTTEPLMIARIYSLAVMELHTAVHTIHLHEAKQTKEESTKAFAARVQGIASSCQLTKLCTCREPVTVSFMEETVYHVVLAGLRDSEMQERCLAAAYLKSVTNLQQLLQFCSAEESSKTSNGSSLIGALKSSYQREKRAGHMQKSDYNKPGSPETRTCPNCGGAPHGKPGEPRWKTKADCPASKVICGKCGKTGHITILCLSSTLAANEQQTSHDVGHDQESDHPQVAAVQSLLPYVFALGEEDQTYEAAAVEEEHENGNNDDANFFAFV